MISWFIYIADFLGLNTRLVIGFPYYADCVNKVKALLFSHWCLTLRQLLHYLQETQEYWFYKIKISCDLVLVSRYS